MVHESSQERSWRASFRAALEGAPEQFFARSKHFLDLSNVLHEEIALSLEKSLNTILESQKVESVKQSTLDDIAETLDRLHLAVKCPISNRPARLTIEPAIQASLGPRLYLTVTDDKGQAVRTASYRALPQLEVMVNNDATFQMRVRKASEHEASR